MNSSALSGAKITTTLSNLLSGIFSEGFRACGLDPLYGQVVLSQRPDLSQYQCNGALPAAKSAKQNPQLIAAKIVDKVQNTEIFSSLAVDGPGFININLQDQFLAKAAQALSSNDYTQLLSPDLKKDSIIDFGGPNVAKPMHVGHLRPTVIGDCLQRLLHFLGLPIKSDIHLGDWGTPMGMLITEVELKSPELPYFDPAFTGDYPVRSPVSIEDLERMYPQAAARCRNEPKDMERALKATVELQTGRRGYRALWKHFVDVSVAALKEDFQELDVTFDFWFGESRYHDRIPALLEEVKKTGHAIISEGALVIPFTEELAGREIPPLLLVKSDGAYLYGTSDLATIEERVRDFHHQQFLYVVDKRQSLHFEQVFLASRISGIANSDVVLEHIGFGTINGPDGRPFKTRAGGVMKLKDLIALTQAEALKRINEVRIAESYSEEERQEIARKVGIAALKFGDLMHEPATDYMFDPAQFTRFEGRTGPYVLYSAVRINSILKKAAEQRLAPTQINKLNGAERELLLEMCHFPDMLLKAYTNRMPNYLCDYAFNLAQVFNRFYLHCHILNERDKELQASWLSIVQLCFIQLKTLMNLLGIELPERM